MEYPTLRADILRALVPGGLTAVDLAKQFESYYTKASINDCLYRMEGDAVRKTVGGPRPMWHLAGGAPPDPGPPTIVLVDLGNVHDCLAPCVRYVADGLVRATYAFADYHFNGYGYQRDDSGKRPCSLSRPVPEGEKFVDRRLQRLSNIIGEP